MTLQKIESFVDINTMYTFAEIINIINNII